MTMTLLLMLLIIVFLMPYRTSVASAIAQPGCPDTCGDVSIPYPFGIGPGCSLEGFELSCSSSNKVTFMNRRIIHEVMNIELNDGQARMFNSIAPRCYNHSTSEFTCSPVSMDLRGTPFRVNTNKNKFTVVGCNNLAYISFIDGTNLFLGGFVKDCRPEEIMLVNGSCSKVGCWQTDIPATDHYHIDFLANYSHSGTETSSRCGYAVLMEETKFSSENITAEVLDNTQVPLVLDWAIRNTTCDAAQANGSSYACRSNYSVCIDSTNGPGYLCNCSDGYEGNPYLEGGCQDIDECAAETSPCGTGKCYNIPGSYGCTCPALIMRQMHNKPQQCQIYLPYLIVICISPIVLLLFGLGIYVWQERRKLNKLKKKYFKEHGGWILYKEMRSSKNYGFSIFSEEDIKRATDNYDGNRIVGQGGHGTVYKGFLRGNIVAIKICKFINESQKREFGKEMLILSEINHKNIVKLLGCCLEVEVPILVYEFVSNGTLFEKIHGKKNGCLLSFENCLRIAHESAEALAYLHSSASPPILHGDVKSSNILLDENYMAKVSDFGASILAPNDKADLVTLVQGTCGYLDPECLITYQLTDKSDVFSFGVVLLELLTGKRPIYFDNPGDEKVLSSCFLASMKENRVEEMLDCKVTKGRNIKLIMQVVELANECLDYKKEDRPSMKEVAEVLGRLTMILNQKSRVAVDNCEEEVQSLLGDRLTYYNQSTRCFSIEKELVLEMQHGR